MQSPGAPAVLTLDTNVVARVVLKDDARQAKLAEDLWRTELKTGGVYLPAIVIVELSWVMKVSAKLDRGTIARSIRGLCSVAGVVVENEHRMHRALRRFESGSADFSDYLILEAANEAQAKPVVTFDQKFSSNPGVTLLE
jgi:predicted nucleic-acid-binding protein